MKDHLVDNNLKRRITCEQILHPKLFNLKIFLKGSHLHFIGGFRKSLTQLQISDHKLAIEQDRYRKMTNIKNFELL